MNCDNFSHIFLGTFLVGTNLLINQANIMSNHVLQPYIVGTCKMPYFDSLEYWYVLHTKMRKVNLSTPYCLTLSHDVMCHVH